MPVLATDVPGHRDVVVYGRTGVLAPAEDSAALVEAIILLEGDAERRHLMGEAGRQRVLDEFGSGPWQTGRRMSIAPR